MLKVSGVLAIVACTPALVLQLSKKHYKVVGLMTNEAVAPADMINPQRPKKKGVCKRGCSKGRKTLLGLLVHIKPKRKQSSHFPNPKRPFPGVSSVCALSITRYFMFVNVWLCKLKCLVT